MSCIIKQDPGMNGFSRNPRDRIQFVFFRAFVEAQKYHQYFYNLSFTSKPIRGSGCSDIVLFEKQQSSKTMSVDDRGKDCKIMTVLKK